jgi:hypothetical protein
MRHWLAKAPDGIPWLTVSPECPYTVRTIPALVSDSHKPEDVDSDGEDHAADALRYFVMSRPPLSQAANPRRDPPPFSLAWLKQQAEVPAGILARR